MSAPLCAITNINIAYMYRDRKCKWQLKTYFDNEEDRLELEDALPQKIPEDENVTQGKDYILIAIIAFCILCYTKNQRFNILQVIAGYFTYANNITKCMVENLHYIEFLIIYKTVRQVLQTNMLIINKKFQKKAWKRRFFLSFDNMNFYKYRKDQCLYNKGYQVAYNIGYICFMRSKDDNQVDGNWKPRYLDAN